MKGTSQTHSPCDSGEWVGVRGLLVLLLLALTACPEPDAPDAAIAIKPTPVTVATLSELRGPVTLTRDGASSPAKPGPVFDGDVLTTGGDGHALLSGAGREVELLENSRFRVGKSLGDLTLDLGELVFLESDAGDYTTALGVARPSAGGRVKLQAVDGGTTFEVGFGALELDVIDGGQQTLKAGQRFVVGVGVLAMDEVPTPTPPPVEVKPTVRLTPRGTVMVKGRAGAAQKLPVSGRELDEVGTFNVDRAGELTVEAGGTRAKFSGGAKGTVEPLKGDARFKTGLREGTVRLFLKEGESVLIDGKKVLTLKATQASTVLVTATKTGPRVEVIGGGVETAVQGGATKQLTTGESTQQRGATLDAAKKGTPVLTLPDGRTSRVNWARGGDVGLQLSEGAGVVEVATDAAFDNVFIAAQASDTLVVPAPVKGALYWRRAGDAQVSQARFERDEHAGAVSAKTDTVAETGLKATVYFQGAVPTLTFTFPPKDAVQSWRFRVYAAGDLKTALVDRRVNESKAVVESGALAEGSYLWSAVPTVNGVEATGGRMNKMDIVFDNSVTRLVLTSPKDGERSAKAVGVAPLGARLTLNGKAVSLDGGGRFAVPLPAGNVAVFKLTTKDGAESYWVRRLSR